MKGACEQWGEDDKEGGDDLKKLCPVDFKRFVYCSIKKYSFKLP